MNMLLKNLFSVTKNESQEQELLYFDHASGTPCSPQVFSVMEPYFVDNAYNPGGMYAASVIVKNSIEKARADIAAHIKARPSEIIFTDGATESDNMAIIGSLKAWRKNHPGQIPHIITTMIEHAAVLETCKYLETQGARITYLSVDKEGRINLKELKKALAIENPVIVSIGYANGEIGTIQDIRGIMKMVRHYRKHNKTTYPLVHSDAVQAINYIDEIGIPQLGIDLMTFNASKIYGPKKIAALFVKTGVAIEPIIYGGNQESMLRSGTENVPYIIGFSEAMKQTRELQSSENQRLRNLRDYFVQELRKDIPHVIINSPESESIPNIINISMPNISHEEIVIRLDAVGVMASVKSACKAGEDGDSHVITAIRHNDILPTGSVRFSMGRRTSKRAIDILLRELLRITKGMNDTYDKYIA